VGAAHYGRPRLLNFNHVYYFHVTAAEGSIKAAAEQLGVTQPTVSEQLRLLERSLGVELFERSPAGLKLTFAGRVARQHAASMFAASDRLLASLGRSSDGEEARLRVGVSVSLARSIEADFLIPVLTGSEYRASIQTADFGELLRELRSRNVDLVIGETAPSGVARRGLTIDQICRPELVALVADEAQPTSDWNNLALLHYSTTSVYRSEVDAFLQREGLRPMLAGYSDDAYLMLDAVLHAKYAAFVPRSLARDAIRERRVKVVASVVPEMAAVYAIYPDDDKLLVARAAVTRLIEGARVNVGALP